MRRTIFFGYAIIVILITGILYMWFTEWNKLEQLEIQNHHIYTFRQESHKAYVLLIEFSLLGETILEWDDDDLEHYHTQRMAMDSMLCRSKAI